jgi:hypothetical protein
LKSACRLALEGIVSKRLDAPYRSGRTNSWTKAKCRAGHEVVVGGWTTTHGRFRSLMVGVHRGEHFVYVGRVGTGYSEAPGLASGALPPSEPGFASTPGELRVSEGRTEDCPLGCDRVPLRTLDKSSETSFAPPAGQTRTKIDLHIIPLSLGGVCEVH